MLRPSVRDVAIGKWPSILAGFGLPERQLSGKHVPCPICGGSDRFRFDNKDGRGTWFCSRCGAGDGIKLLMSIKGWDFKTAAHEIERIVGVVAVGEIPKSQDEEEKVRRLQRVWSESLALRDGDEVCRYLAGRGLRTVEMPLGIRLHPGLAYYEGEIFVGKFPVMLARVVAPDGQGLTLHRTYLSNGRKAPVDSVKKLMPGKPVSGGAVRLFAASWHLGIAEGIETALAASALFSLPVWSCISAHGIETFDPPPGIERITIFADNDETFTGQRAAFAAAFRLKQQGVAVDVQCPDVHGDWLDVLLSRKATGA